MTNRCDKHAITSEGRCPYCETDDKYQKTWQDAIQSGEVFVRDVEPPKLYLEPSLSVTTERMGPGFLKVNLEMGKSRIHLHHFTEPDLGDPHDHPFPFTRTILLGGYVEEVWRMRNGEFFMETHVRSRGQTSYVGDGEVHRIVSLLGGECVSSVVWHDDKPRREPHFYQFDTGGRVRIRRWDQETWMELRT